MKTLEEAITDTQKAYDSLCSIPDEELTRDQIEAIDNIAQVQRALINRLKAAMEPIPNS